MPAVKHVHRGGDGAASAVDAHRAIMCAGDARARLRCVLARDVLCLGVGSVVVAAALSLTHSGAAAVAVLSAPGQRSQQIDVVVNMGLRDSGDASWGQSACGMALVTAQG